MYRFHQDISFLKNIFETFFEREVVTSRTGNFVLNLFDSKVSLFIMATFDRNFFLYRIS